MKSALRVLAHIRFSGGALAAAASFNITTAATVGSKQPKDANNELQGSIGSGPELTATYDSYGGVIIDSDCVKNISAADFRSRLSSSVAAWRGQGKRGIWLKVPVERVQFVADATDLGFVLHHCEKDYVMLTYWIPGETGAPNTLPGYTSHTVGVGGVVINNKGEVLVVQEKSGPAAGIDFWKYPTGMVEPGEDAAAAVVREVKEETGIDAEVVQLVSFREAHTASGSSWMSGKTNIFMVFLLKPHNLEISKQNSEIAECKWLSLAEYWANSEKRMKPGTLYHAMLGLTCDAHNGSILGFASKEVALGFRPGTNMLYFPAEATSCVVERIRQEQILQELASQQSPTK